MRDGPPSCRSVSPPRGGRREVRGRVSALLLAGGVARGAEAGAVPPAGDRGPGAFRRGPRLAPGDAGASLPRGRRPARIDTLPDRRRNRPGEPGERHRLVDGPHRARRRGHGGEAAGVRAARHARAGAAGGEVPGPRVPAHGLRARRPGGRKPLPAAGARAGGEAVAGAGRVRAGPGRAGALRPPRAAAARPRVRLRRAGAGERASGPAAVNPHRSGIHPPSRRHYSVGRPTGTLPWTRHARRSWSKTYADSAATRQTAASSTATAPARETPSRAWFDGTGRWCSASAAASCATNTTPRTHSRPPS